MDKVINNSKFYQSTDKNDRAGSKMKWFIAIITGLLAGIIFSPIFLSMLSSASRHMRGPYLIKGSGATLLGLICQTIIFILLFRILLG